MDNGEKAQMTKEERNRRYATVARQIYLCPSGSPFENFGYGFIWAVSWLLGIVIQSKTNQTVLGGAFLIFGLSVVMTFINDIRNHWLPRLFYCTMIVFSSVMAIISVLYFIGNIPDLDAFSEETLVGFRYTLFISGWLIFGIITLCAVLGVIKLHSWIFKLEEAEAKEKQDQQLMIEEILKNYLDHEKGSPAVTGNPNGGGVEH